MVKSNNKHILFYYPIFNLGGAERSTIKLMNAFLNRGYSVSLLLKTGGGDFENEIPKEVRLIYLRNRMAGVKFRTRKSLSNLPYLIAYLSQLLNQEIQLFKLKKHSFEVCFISLQGLSPKSVLRLKKINKFIHIIRNDIGGYDSVKKVKKAVMPFHQKIDAYLCVAEQVKSSFIEIFPFLKDKTYVTYNLLQGEIMIEKSNMGTNPFPKLDKLIVLTVCRLNEAAKGLIRMARVHKQLLNAGKQHYWYVVGDGSDRGVLEREIKHLNISDSFILLGHQDNPYPYFKYCDIAATLSFYEGFCGTVNEAKVMGKPVIATRFSGINEQIIHGENGLIVENNQEAIYSGMKLLLSDPSKLNQLTNDFLPKMVRNDKVKVDSLIELIDSLN